jgi:hypothetical protein
MFFNLSHLNAKLRAAPQGNYNSGMLAVDLCRIATQAMSHSNDLFVYYPSAFTELHEKAPDGKRQAGHVRQRRLNGDWAATLESTLLWPIGVHEIRS